MGPSLRAVSLAAELGALLGQGRRHTWSAAAQRLEAQGESVYAWNLLHRLHQLGPRTQRELAQALAQHPAGVGRLLEELEERGLVRRERSAADRRKLVVTATARGRRWYRAVHPAVIQAVASALSTLTDREQRTLRALLLKLVGGPADRPAR